MKEVTQRRDVSPPTSLERATFSSIEWIVIDRPNSQNGEDHFEILDKEAPDATHYSVAAVTDGAISAAVTHYLPADVVKKAGNEPLTRVEGRQFCQTLTTQLVSGEDVNDSIMAAESAIADYYPDRTPEQIFDPSFTPKAHFAFVSTRITYPKKEGETFLVDATTYRDCFIAALMPDEKYPSIYIAKTFPMSDEIHNERSFFPPGSILFLGTDGCFNHFINYDFIKALLSSLPKNIEEFLLKRWHDEVSFNLETSDYSKSQAALESFFSILAIIFNLNQKSAQQTIEKLKEEINNSVNRIRLYGDDVTLLMTQLPLPLNVL